MSSDGRHVTAEHTRGIRLLSVIESLGRGGAERLLVTLHRHLPENFRASVVSLYGPDPLAQEIEATGARVHRLRSSRRRPFATHRRLRRIVREFAPDIVHTHLFHGNLMGRLAARGSAPVLTSLHNPDYSYEGSGVLGWRKLVDRATKRWTEHFLAVSEAVAADYRQHLGLRDVQVLHNFVDLAAARERASRRSVEEVRAEAKTPQSAIVLMHVGRFSPQKGHDVLVDAFARVLESRHDVVLWLVGEGQGRASIESRCRTLGIDRAVRFIGSVAEPMPYLAAADVFVFPSRFEAFGIALVEAMAVGLPVVATAVGGITEVVGEEGGILVPAGAVGALADACIDLAGSPERRLALADRARDRAKAFDVSVLLPHLIRIYEAL